jgi:hypothetical protein
VLSLSVVLHNSIFQEGDQPGARAQLPATSLALDGRRIHELANRIAISAILLTDGVIAPFAHGRKSGSAAIYRNRVRWARFRFRAVLTAAARHEASGDYHSERQRQ